MALDGAGESRASHWPPDTGIKHLSLHGVGDTSKRTPYPGKSGVKLEHEGIEWIDCVDALLSSRKGGFMRIGKYETSEKSTTGTAVTFLMIGLGAGALIALLLAPKSGKQMRKDLRRKYDDARDTLQDWSEDARERVGDVVDRSAEWAEELRDVAREKAAPIAKAIRRD
jgi:gas vesicle protein